MIPVTARHVHVKIDRAGYENNGKGWEVLTVTEHQLTTISAVQWKKLKAPLIQSTATKSRGGSERSTIGNFGLVLPGSKQVHKIQQTFIQSYAIMNQSITIARKTYARNKTHTRARHFVTSLRHLTRWTLPDLK